MDIVNGRVMAGILYLLTHISICGYGDVFVKLSSRPKVSERIVIADRGASCHRCMDVDLNIFL
jgi:hypothetical protein